MIRITLKPREYVEVNFDNQRFNKRIKGWEVGEVILKDCIIISFKKEIEYKIDYEIAWDFNELEITEISWQIGFM